MIFEFLNLVSTHMMSLTGQLNLVPCHSDRSGGICILLIADVSTTLDMTLLNLESYKFCILKSFKLNSSSLLICRPL